jgi:hypothetical protein
VILIAPTLLIFPTNGEVTLMARNTVFSSALLAASVLLISACASPPRSSTPADSPGERLFQREAANYLKFENDGKTVYCTREKNGNSLIPYTGHVRCVSESQLRQTVENWQRTRNPVQRPFIGTASSIG